MSFRTLKSLMKILPQTDFYTNLELFITLSTKVYPERSRL